MNSWKYCNVQIRNLFWKQQMETKRFRSFPITHNNHVVGRTQVLHYTTMGWNYFYNSMRSVVTRSIFIFILHLMWSVNIRAAGVPETHREPAAAGSLIMWGWKFRWFGSFVQKLTRYPMKWVPRGSPAAPLLTDHTVSYKMKNRKNVVAWKYQCSFRSFIELLCTNPSPRLLHHDVVEWKYYHSWLMGNLFFSICGFAAHGEKSNPYFSSDEDYLNAPSEVVSKFCAPTPSFVP